MKVSQLAILIVASLAIAAPAKRDEATDGDVDVACWMDWVIKARSLFYPEPSNKG
jgi:hypothetical protein